MLVIVVDMSSLIVESGLPASRAEETSPQKVSEGSVCGQSVGGRCSLDVYHSLVLHVFSCCQHRVVTFMSGVQTCLLCSCVVSGRATQ